jgi:ABC-type glutathione transport system ATPase component
MILAETIISPPTGTQSTGLEVTGLKVRTQDGRTIVSALDLHVDAGETIGIVGESGSGKSMTARAVVGLLPAGIIASGEALWRDTICFRCPSRSCGACAGARSGL